VIRAKLLSIYTISMSLVRRNSESREVGTNWVAGFFFGGLRGRCYGDRRRSGMGQRRGWPFSFRAVAVTGHRIAPWLVFAPFLMEPPILSPAWLRQEKSRRQPFGAAQLPPGGVRAGCRPCVIISVTDAMGPADDQNLSRIWASLKQQFRSGRWRRAHDDLSTPAPKKGVPPLFSKMSRLSCFDFRGGGQLPGLSQPPYFSIASGAPFSGISWRPPFPRTSGVCGWKTEWGKAGFVVGASSRPAQPFFSSASGGGGRTWGMEKRALRAFHRQIGR